MAGSLIARLRNLSLGYLVAMDAIGSSLWSGFGSPGLVNHLALIGSVVQCDGAICDTDCTSSCYCPAEA